MRRLIKWLSEYLGLCLNHNMVIVDSDNGGYVQRCDSCGKVYIYRPYRNL